jgi:hypothetical protein
METFIEDEKIVVYCVCGFVENKKIILYYGDFDNIVIASIESIFRIMTSDLIEIYIHNLNFDGMLLIDAITREKINFKMFSRGVNLYYIDLFYSFKRIRFRCSYKLIGVSLKLVGEIEKYLKINFPYRFVNRQTLFYVGPRPSAQY